MADAVEKRPVSGVFRLPHKGLHACGKHAEGKPVPQGETCGKGMDRLWKAQLLHCGGQKAEGSIQLFSRYASVQLTEPVQATVGAPL